MNKWEKSGNPFEELQNVVQALKASIDSEIERLTHSTDKEGQENQEDVQELDG
jgi:hypothetical protein